MPVGFIPWNNWPSRDRFRGYRLRIDDLGQFADERRSWFKREIDVCPDKYLDAIDQLKEMTKEIELITIRVG